MRISYEVKAVLFDFDGVVINPARHNELEWMRFARLHGLNEATIYERALGRSTRETMIALSRERPFDVDQACIDYDDHSLSTFDGIEVVPGIVDVLTSLPADRWAIVTSSTRSVTLNRLDHFGLPHPHVLVAADDLPAGQGKPLPTPYVMGAKLLGVDPSEAIAVEDSPSGIESAHRARCKNVVVIRTNVDPTSLPVRRGDSMIDDFRSMSITPKANGLVVDVDSLQLAAGKGPAATGPSQVR